MFWLLCCAAPRCCAVLSPAPNHTRERPTSPLLPRPCQPHNPRPHRNCPCTAQGLLRESQQANERLQKEYSGLAEKVGRLHHSLEEHIHANTQLLADNSQRQVEIKGKEDEIRALRVSRGWGW